MNNEKTRRLVLLAEDPDGTINAYTGQKAFVANEEKKGIKHSLRALYQTKLPGFYKGKYFRWVVIQRGDEKDAVMLARYQK